MNREDSQIFAFGPNERGMRELNNQTIQGSKIYCLARAGLTQ
jgi:hypothetical protein